MRSGWQRKRLGYVIREVQRPVRVDPHGSYQEIGVRSHGRGIFHKDPVSGIDLGDKKVFWIKPGDLVFNIVFAWEGAVAVAEASEEGFIGSHRFPTYRPVKNEVDVRFLKHLFDSKFGRFHLDQCSPGAAGRNRTLDRGSLLKEKIGVPPLAEQRLICDFIERKTSKIDTLIQKKQRLIELLNEKRAALISHAVTRGLDPGVPMRASGVEWIGDVPAHWDTRKVSWIFSVTGSGTTPRAGNDIYYKDGTIPWVITGNLQDKTVDVATTKQITAKAMEEHAALRLFPEQSLLIALYGATIGKLGILNEPATMNQACFAMAEPRGVLTRFAFYCLLAARVHLISLGYGGGQPNISGETVRQLKVPIPNIEEQARITDFLDGEYGYFSILTTKVATAIERLQEYRAALISAAVTGQIDVRNEV